MSPSHSPISRHIRVGKSDYIDDDDDDVYVHKHILFIKYCLTNSSLPYSTDTYCHAFVFVFVSLFVVFHDKYQKLQVKDIAEKSANLTTHMPILEFLDLTSSEHWEQQESTVSPRDRTGLQK